MSERLKTIELEKEYLMRKHLRRWKENEYRLKTADVELKRLDDYMYFYPATLGATPVQGGASKREDCLVNTIDEKTLVEEGVAAAREYFEELKPAWEALTDDERYMIYTRWVVERGVNEIMAKYHVEKSAAYNKSSEALARLASLYLI